MKKDQIDHIFSNLKGSFDTEEPAAGHQLRFQQKLQTLHQKEKRSYSKTLWRPLMAAAAIITIALAVFISKPADSEGMELSSVSTDYYEAQNFFTIALREELQKVEAQRSPLTEHIIYDGLRQLNKLETQYNQLKLDLETSQQDNRVIYAMISNFQTRIDILTNLLEQIENIKQLKVEQNETSTTI
jgi:hypothetical protein